MSAPGFVHLQKLASKSDKHTLTYTHTHTFTGHKRFMGTKLHIWEPKGIYMGTKGDILETRGYMGTKWDL